MAVKTCQRCKRELKYRRVTCVNCGRSIGKYYDCGCAELFTESGPQRYFCISKNWNQRGTADDCRDHRAEMRQKKDELPPSFVKRMHALGNDPRWPE